MESDSLKVTDAYSASKSTHPRVSLQDMKDNIAGEFYFTLDQALTSVPVPQAFGLMTICALHMRNGFTVIGKSAPASPGNFDPEKGRVFAYEDAIRQLWPLEGYALRSKLSEIA